MKHVTCEAVVLHCIDFRLRKALYEFLMKRFPEGYDLVSVAGSVKRLLQDGPDNNFVLEQLQISDRLHRPQTIVLISHEDCGAYGGSKAFEDSAAEEKFHREELQKAKELLKTHFSQNIETHFARFSGEIT